jgi:hypothetical protein
LSIHFVPNLSGCEPIRVFLKVSDPEERKRGVISQVKLLDGVLLILDLLGEWMQVLMFVEPDRVAKTLELMKLIAGGDETIVLRNWQALGFRRCEMGMKPTDLEVMKSLRKNPRKSIQQVARETEVSQRTVERRIGRLTEGCAIFHMFRLDLPRMDGVVCSLIVTYQDEKRKAGVDESVASRLERMIYSATGAKTTSVFNFVCKNVVDAESVRAWAGAMKGVGGARFWIMTEYILVSDWVDREIEKMRAALGRV